ncbi:hypothetical protein RJ640_003826 [Escallonia rubra]|uniref:valine--tRNA ligase n=1 Tax=Escallonia rubra TaxID=112253 RepID=A0AA88RTL3_9ASTE|nr:hypothetical protein RJ640_003826 [Escallonia rubra]
MAYGRHVPIIADKYVDKDFGTGVLKISPGHDQNDYLLARKLGLPILNVMNKDGTLNDVAGLYCGLDRFEARRKLWSDLEESGLAVKKEPHTLRVPRSQRGGEIIEPLVSKQWFVTMDSLAEKALKAVENGELNIMPERFEKIYNHWLSNIKDWCISRQLWWGHRLPVWYIVGKDCEEDYIVARSTEEALDKARQKYGKNVEIYQDPDVLDTWFSSALWPFSTLGWPDVSTEDFKRFYPTTMLETGHDILFFWVARMVMMGIEFTGTVPFSNIYLHGLIRDSQGRKMSKTLGNVIDPLDTIKEFGTDALRFSIALGTAGQDLNLSTERLTANKAFTNKLWNAGKFVLQNMPSQGDQSAWESLYAYEVCSSSNICIFVLLFNISGKLGNLKIVAATLTAKITHPFDEDDCLLRLPLPECWVVSKLHILVDVVTTSYDKFFFGDVGREIYDFFWADFADWYIEASKARLNHSEGHSVASVAQAVLLYVFQNILKVLHPFMPFVTEELWQALPNRKEALMVSSWPQTSLPKHANSMKRFENLQALTRAIRNARAEYSVEPAKRISATIVANSDVIQYVSKEKEVLALLSRLDLQNIHFTESPPGDANQSVHLVASEGLEAYLPLADMVDISAEVQRLSKRLSKMQTEHDALVARLRSHKLKSPPDAKLALGFFHWSAHHKQTKHESSSYCIAVHILVKAKLIKDARALLEAILTRAAMESSSVFSVVETLVSSYEVTESTHFVFDLLVQTCAKLRLIDGVMDVVYYLDERGFKLGVISYNTLIHVVEKSGQPGLVWRVYEHMVENRTYPNEVTVRIMVNALCKEGKLQKFVDIVDRMHGKRCSPWVIVNTYLIFGMVEEGRIEDGLVLLKRVLQKNMIPDTVAYSLVVYARVKLGDVEYAWKVFDGMLKRGFNANCFLYTLFIGVYCEEGKIEEANVLMLEMENGGLKAYDETFNHLIVGCSKVGRVEESLKFCEKMIDVGLVPSCLAFNELVEGLCENGDVKLADEMLTLLLDKEFVPDETTYCHLISGYGKKGSFEGVMKLYHEMEYKSLSCSYLILNSLIISLCHCGRLEEAERYLRVMKDRSLSPSGSVYKTLIASYFEKGDKTRADQLYSELVGQGLDLRFLSNLNGQH